MDSETFTVEQGFHLFALHHKQKNNCQLEVVLELSAAVCEPQFRAGEWVVPCDVVGLDSKKAKVVKIRFHPSVEELSRGDKAVREAAFRDSLKYIDDLLEDSVWTRKEIDVKDRFEEFVEKIATCLTTNRAELFLTDDRLELSWFCKCGENLSPACKSDYEALMGYMALKSYSHAISTHVYEEAEKTCAELRFGKNEKNRVLSKIFVSSGTLSDGTFEEALQMNENVLKWTIPRNVDNVKLPVNIQVFVGDGKTRKELIISKPQIDVTVLKTSLDASLSEQTRCKALKDSPRILSLIRPPGGQDEEVIVEMTEPEEMPVLSRVLIAASEPLNVNCDVFSSDTELASSPAESMDSGVSLSPLGSPCGKIYARDEYLRERSFSESIWCSNGLKGILKKPNRWDRLARSVSECHDGNSSHEFLSRSPTFEATDEEEEKDEGRRKKRVSFSSTVQERKFRIGQCIGSQKKKNQKKKESRLRKEEKLRKNSDGCDTSCDEGSCVNLSKEDLVFEDAEKPARKSKHLDSGFGDDDDDVPEKEWQNAVRRVRAASH
ncbi:unnamed protein product [Caenorhabditis auriculariae]|uniref:Uncharacterized protein n=1 Tax=Caenorhabditis auriculariae TaxID=2777116 RepID=A0A8S1GVH1_9PELO|nr:unnamed protein product [Caenorhabditis auriculariae]